MTLTGKRALVTGASRGIGAAIAKAFTSESADVAITYEKSVESAAEVVSGIKAKGRNPKEIAMSIRSMLVAATFASASLEAAHADGLRPISAISIDLGEVSGVAYYTVGRDGFHVVTTLAQGMAGTPIRVVSVLAPGQSLAFSTPHQKGALEISRNGDSVLVRKVKSVSN